jgi:hypothetical protein
MLYCPPPPSGIVTPIPEENFVGYVNITTVNSTTIEITIVVPQMQLGVGGVRLQFLSDQLLNPKCSWPNAPGGWSALGSPDPAQCRFYYHGGPVGPLYVNFGPSGIPTDYYLLFMTYPYDEYYGTKWYWANTNPPSGEYWYAWHVVGDHAYTGEFLNYQYPPTPLS